MPTFDTIRDAADNRAFVRKIQKAVAFLAPMTVALPTSLFAADGNSLIDLDALGFLPVGMVTPDGYTFGREINKEDVNALGYASPVRSDVTSVPRSVSFTALENTKRHMLELKYGANLAAVTQKLNASGEIVFEEPDLPIGEEYRLLVIGSDGPAAANWILGKGYGTVKLAGTGDESWGQEGAIAQEYTLDVFNDEGTGSPVRHYIGGTGAALAANRTALGFTQAAV